MANDIVLVDDTCEIAVVGDVLTRRQPEVVADRRLGVGIVVHCEAVSIRQCIEIRHRRAIHYVFVALVLGDDNKDTVE